ncbi:MAG: hypothetical protein L3J37_02560 [Rhodobacteraceae bacterium]|nr:hypothetical protein [Paracoccaceae bacterium]
MLYLLAFILGFALGWFTATKKGGNTADKIQYGVIFGMIAMVLLMFSILILGFVLI